MAKYNRNLKVVYPDEKEGKVRDANKKLKSQIRTLKKAVKKLESENKTLNRAYSKSCNFIQDSLSNKSLEQIMGMIEDFDYKETEKGREKEEIKDTANNCPECDNAINKGYVIMDFEKFTLKSCKCGYRSKVNTCEGNERS